MDGHKKQQRIQSKNKTHLQMFADILKPEVLHTAVPRLGEVAEARQEYKNMMQQAAVFGKYCRDGGFDPTRQFQHVAHIDSSVWSAILRVFGAIDEETGELVDDGLLYIKDTDGRIKLNKPFFYSLINWLDQNGYPCDMRCKIKLN